MSLIGPDHEYSTSIYYGRPEFILIRAAMENVAEEKKTFSERAFQLSAKYIMCVDKLLLTMN